jgi:uncharacterized protein with FMN-binding domain
MKKLILSTFVLASFGFYVILQNVGNTTGNFSMLPPITTTNNTKNTTAKQVTSTPKTTPVVNKPPSGSSGSMMGNGGMMTGSIYRNGTYTGNSADAYYGYIQVKAVITNGRLTDVIFLDHPQDRGTSIRINTYAMPILKSEAIKAQSAKVNTVSGASDSSAAFRESLANALAQAKI